MLQQAITDTIEINKKEKSISQVKYVKKIQK